MSGKSIVMMLLLHFFFMLGVLMGCYYIWDVVIKDFNSEVSDVKAASCMSTSMTSVLKIKKPILRNKIEYSHILQNHKTAYFITTDRLRDFEKGKNFCFSYERVKLKHAIKIKRFII